MVTEKTTVSSQGTGLSGRAAQERRSSLDSGLRGARRGVASLLRDTRRGIAEIDLDARELVALEGEELRVPESVARRGLDLVANEGFVASPSARPSALVREFGPELALVPVEWRQCMCKRYDVPSPPPSSALSLAVARPKKTVERPLPRSGAPFPSQSSAPSPTSTPAERQSGACPRPVEPPISPVERPSNRSGATEPPQSSAFPSQWSLRSPAVHSPQPLSQPPIPARRSTVHITSTSTVHPIQEFSHRRRIVSNRAPFKDP
jgi:hypothetical protein